MDVSERDVSEARRTYKRPLDLRVSTRSHASSSPLPSPELLPISHHPRSKMSSIEDMPCPFPLTTEQIEDRSKLIKGACGRCSSRGLSSERRRGKKRGGVGGWRKRKEEVGAKSRQRMKAAR